MVPVMIGGMVDAPPRRGSLALVAVAASLAVVGLGACGASDAPGSSGKPLVVVTTSQLADFAGIVGAGDVEVYALLRPNVDAHDFEISPADLDALNRADVILENGQGLEPWLDDAVDASGADAPVVDTSEGAHLIHTGHEGRDHEGEDSQGHEGHEHDHGDVNPHLWHDPTNAEVMVDHTADALADIAPDAADDIEARAGAYTAELVELDAWITEQIATLDDPKLVTDHDAFAYYVERYGLTHVGSVIPSFDSAAEVSTGDLNDLADAIEREGVRAIFTEQSLPPKASEALARRTGAAVVSGTDGLYGDSLGPEGSGGDTYLDMMRHNTRSIVEHLGSGADG